MQINPYLIFPGTCREALDFYAKVLGGELVALFTHADMPPEDQVHGPDFADKVMHGQIVVDSRDAEHEAGDLLQAGLPVAQYPSLADVMSEELPRATGPVLFKSCGWGGWDLAAARLAVRTV